jgi:hypothetical protein
VSPLLLFRHPAKCLDAAMWNAMMNLSRAMQLSKSDKWLMSSATLLILFSSACFSAEKMAVFEFEFIRSNAIAGVRGER